MYKLSQQDNIAVKIETWDLEHTKNMLKARGIETSESVSNEIHERLQGYPQYLNLFCTLALNDTAEELLQNIPKAVKEAYNYLKTEVYNSLSSNEKILLHVIAIFRVPETMEAFDSVKEFEDLSETLDKLINKFLVNEIGSNTFKVHDIICDYCLSDPKKKALRKFHENAAEYYLSLNNEPENILEAAYHFEKASLHEKSSEILILNAGNFISKGYWDKIEVQLNNSIKSFQRKTHPRINSLVAGAHFNIARLYETKEEYDLALKHAIQSQLFINKNKSQRNNNLASVYNLFCSVYSGKGETEKAYEYNEKCFQIAKSQGDKVGEAVVFANRASFLKNKDDKLRFEYQLGAIEIFENYGALRQLAPACTNIALDYLNIKNFEKAYEYIRKSLKIIKERDDIYEIALTKFKMAIIYSQDPDKPINYNQIIECLENVLETYEKIGHKRGVTEVRYQIGVIYNRNKHYELAMENFQYVLELSEKIGDKLRFANTLRSIGELNIEIKNFELAIDYYQKSLDLLLLLKKENDILIVRLSLVEAFLLFGKFEEALDELYKITELDTGKSNLDKRTKALSNIFSAISFIMLKEITKSHDFLRKIGEFDNEGFPINWDFSAFKPILENLEENKQVFLDVIDFYKGTTSFPIIRPEDVTILEEEKGKQAQVYHPLVGFLTISVNDIDLEKLIKQINQTRIINFDTSDIFNLERKKALLMLGFLLKKGVCKIQSLEDQKYKFELTDKGSRLLKSIDLEEHSQVKLYTRHNKIQS